MSNVYRPLSIRELRVLLHIARKGATDEAFQELGETTVQRIRGKHYFDTAIDTLSSRLARMEKHNRREDEI